MAGDEGDHRYGPSDRYDVVVIGAGSAGLTGARTAARLGARTLLVEADRLGGDCLWTGCVPSKALIHAAGRGAGFGAAMASVRRAVRAVEPHDSAEALEPLGVEVAYGAARFTGPRSVTVDGREVRFRYALIATGSAPALPPVPGLAERAPLTSDDVWGLEEPPERLVVLGGGAVGCELGQSFARLGALVTVVEALDRLLPGEEERAGELVRAALERDGVRVLTGVRAADAAELPEGRLLVAAGRRPRTEGLGLDAAGVRCGERGHVRVDGRLRTANRRVYAAGDVTEGCAFTHLAGVQAAAAVTDAVLGVRRRIDYGAVPRVTFTDPEVAVVGAGEGSGVRRRVLPHSEVDRAVADGRTDGYTALELDRRGRIVGATVVAPRAGEVIAQLAAAVRLGWTASRYAATVHPYPTYADGPWNAALGEVYAGLAGRRGIGALRAVRRVVRR